MSPTLNTLVSGVISFGEWEVKTREGPQPIDVLVERRVRMLRVSRGLSQSDLAREVGITFQQVQKYEKGTNRISASMLHGIARVLGVPEGQFFVDAGEAEKLTAELAPPRRIDLQIVHALVELPEGALKEQINALIFTLAGKTTPAVSD
jgi:transcriptional regulator with XRE-family HTH domain